ncbi:hypothetical protein IGI37_002169 [Enterococcus sp. AZ194]|uniref:Gfo/Idh/MocA family protein n=1 Tax=Enterococcus sp. AZ194 TaxID=2774629 RepID=UPI003F2616B0
MTIGFGIIGLGNRGYKYALRTISKQKDCHIEIVCDTNENNFDQFPTVEKTTDYQQVLNHPNVQAVFISTPDDTHGEIMLAAAAAGKHILCEKPLEISTEKIVALWCKLSAYPNVIEIGYVLRYARLFQKARQLLDEGLLGDLVMINAIDHIPYGGYAFFHDWHRLRKNSGSLLLQKATHSLDLLNFFVNSLPEKVVGFGGLATMGKPGALKKFGHPVPTDLHCCTCPYQMSCEESIQNLATEKNINWGENWPDSCVFHEEIDVDDHQTLAIQYQNGAKASYQLCQFSAYYKREFQLFGSKGEMIIEDATNTITFRNRLKNESIIYTDSSETVEMETGDLEQLQDFIQAIHSQKAPVSSLSSSVAVGLLALAAQESIDQKKIMTLSWPKGLG